jgi:hypothetical protein
MFDHVRGDQLDQRKYPWISLTQAAIYLMSPDDAERLRAVNSHDWKRPFEHLREWIEDGKLTVYDGWTGPFQPIPKEVFFGVPIRYPSYPDDRQEDIRRAYQPGFRAFIECNLLPPRDQYFESKKYAPKWRDLKIRSQQLITVFEAANIEAFMKSRPPTAPPISLKTANKRQSRDQSLISSGESEWGEIETKCYDLMDDNGDFTPDDPDWDCQARLETALMKFCQETWGREPGASTLRDKLPEWLSAWRKRKTGKA